MNFPVDFLWGAASAAHQVEGAYDADGKGMGIWDTMTMEPGHVAHGENGQHACEHYYHYKEDIALMKKIGLKSYRFSISWPRILPDGTGRINQAGLQFYIKLVDELTAAGIEPIVTLYHWNLPTALYEKGGWKNPESAAWFREYTSVIAAALKGRVKYWLTFNEPQVFVGVGMQIGAHAPFEHLGREELLTVTKHILLAHGYAVRILRSINPVPVYIGYSPSADIVIPKEETPEDIQHARDKTCAVDSFGFSFSNTWWSDPMFFGHFPETTPAELLEAMPAISAAEWSLISQPLDFYGFNSYYGGGNPMPADPDSHDRYSYPGSARTSMDWNVTPEVLYWGAKFFYERYKKPILVTENGFSLYDHKFLDGEVHDPSRIDFIHRYLLGLGRAVREGIPVIGYQYWSVMDNFEWAMGYDKRFGLIYIDYRTQERTLKDSALWYKKVIETNGSIL